jgi:Uma2 family endonuclease
MSAVLDLPRHRFSREQYERRVDAGVFGPEDRPELLNGEIIDMPPQKSRHATAVTLVSDVLRTVFGPGATVRLQLPFSLDDHSQPEPDVAVVPGNPRDYTDAHPDRAVLICEVSDTTLSYDRGHKLAAYAQAGIPEYWILDLTAETLEIYRMPHGNGYEERRVMHAQDHIAPLSGSGQDFPVRDLLP